MTPEAMAKVAAVQRQLVKEAVVGMLARAGRALVRNPGKAFGGAMTGMTAVTDVDRASQLVNKFPTQALPVQPVTM